MLSWRCAGEMLLGGQEEEEEPVEAADTADGCGDDTSPAGVPAGAYFWIIFLGGRSELGLGATGTTRRQRTNQKQYEATMSRAAQTPTIATTPPAPMLGSFVSATPDKSAPVPKSAMPESNEGRGDEGKDSCRGIVGGDRNGGFGLGADGGVGGGDGGAFS